MVGALKTEYSSLERTQTVQVPQHFMQEELCDT